MVKIVSIIAFIFGFITLGCGFAIMFTNKREAIVGHIVLGCITVALLLTVVIINVISKK